MQMTAAKCSVDVHETSRPFYLCPRCGECLPCTHKLVGDHAGWMCQGQLIWIPYVPFRGQRWYFTTGRGVPSPPQRRASLRADRNM